MKTKFNSIMEDQPSGQSQDARIDYIKALLTAELRGFKGFGFRNSGGPFSVHEAGTSIPNLIVALKEAQTPLLVAILEPTGDWDGFELNLSRNNCDNTAVMRYVFVKGGCVAGGQEYRGILVLVSGQKPSALWDRFIKGGIPKISQLNFIYDAKWAYNLGTPTARLTEMTGQPLFSLCTDPELQVLFEAAAVPLLTKLMSVLASCYPFVRPQLIVYGDMVPFSELAVFYGLDPSQVEGQSLDIRDPALKSLIGVALLLPAYSDANMAPIQIQCRLKAACAAYSATPPTETVVRAAVAHYATLFGKSLLSVA